MLKNKVYDKHKYDALLADGDFKLLSHVFAYILPFFSYL